MARQDPSKILTARLGGTLAAAAGWRSRRIASRNRGVRLVVRMGIGPTLSSAARDATNKRYGSSAWLPAFPRAAGGRVVSTEECQLIQVPGTAITASDNIGKSVS